MALKKPSDLFGISKVSSLNEEIEKVSLESQETLVEDKISESFSNIDSVFKDIQNQLQESNQSKINDIREEVVSLYGVVDNIIENEIPKYRNRLETSELRVESRINNLKGELCEHLENQVKSTKQKIEELYADVLEEEVFSAKKFVKDLYHSEIQLAVEKYVSTYSDEIISLREEVFKEIKKKPSSLGHIESKLNDLYSKYKSLSENLNINGSNDPLLTSPVTVEQLRNHYQLLVGRLQEQLASIGGGGEVRLQYLDDVVGVATNASAYDGKYLKYDHSIGKFVFDDVTTGLATETQTLNNVLGLGNISSRGMSVGIVTATSLNVTGTLSGDGSNLSGVVTSLSGYATEGYVDSAVAGVVTFSGNYNDLTNKPTIPSDTGDLTNSVGFVTSGIVVGYATIGYVDATVSGILTAGSLVGYATEGYVDSAVAGVVTFSGNYNDLTNKPTIPSDTGDLTNSVGFVTSGSLSGYLTSYTETSTLNDVLGRGNTSGIGISVGISTFSGDVTVGTGITLYSSTGIVSATSFYGNFFGSITNATNLTGGYANASELNVSGITTISQGRIQANADSNLRFGNLPAGSGSPRNIAIGDQVLNSLSGGSGRNIGIGELAYYDTTDGQYNIGIGIQAGQKITTGSYNVIIGGYNGQTGLDLRTSSNNVVIADGQGNIRQYIDSSGNVGIKTTVVTEALTVAGVVSATSFYGTLNASQLTGILPAIDGSNLFGVTATGTGIEIKDDGTPVGTARTVNFADNISVSFASGIATVSGASSVSAATTAYGLAGTPNLNVGYTTATTFKVGSSTLTNGSLNLEGNIYSGNLVLSNRNLLFTGGWDGGSNYGDFIFQKRGTFGNLSEVARIFGATGAATFNGTTKLAGISTFTSTGISILTNLDSTGIITASSFSGSASGLTNIPSGQLTGNLPAIDGSALLNVNATGEGIVVEDSGSNVGSARTVNFGTGLDVTYSASGIATVNASGGSLQSRTIVSGSTTSIADLGIGNTDITGFKSYALMKVGLSTTGWLRLYTDSTSRANDVSRSVGEDPTPGSGVIAEVVTTGISTTQIISPFVMGGNLDNPADTTIYASIKNLSGSTQSITANLTILQLEA